MLPLMKRTGFDAAQLRRDQSREAAARALEFFDDGHYQGDVTEPRPVYARPVDVKDKEFVNVGAAI
jgi:uncharacterized protein (DUF934 family)